MNSYKVESLKGGMKFSEDLVIDKTFLLLNHGVEVTESLVDALREWRFTEVYMLDQEDGKGAVGDAAPVSSGSAAKGAEKSIRLKTEDVSMEDLGIHVSNQSMSNNVSTSSLAETQEEIEKKFDFSFCKSEKQRMTLVQQIHDEYLSFVFDLYTFYATHKKIDFAELTLRVRELYIFIKLNRRYVLQVLHNHVDEPKSFLIGHSLRSTILAITMGMQLLLDTEKIVELGVACILHEIGMIRLPSQLYLSNKMLSPTEKNLLHTHPIISYTILKDLEAPLSICLAALEHHEKEDGSGYPRHMQGEKISLYAKIISVACSFEAITARRSYKEAASSFAAMVELLKNQTKQYDELVIKALLHSLSLFPIGSYVYLFDGRIGKVIDVNFESPKNPIVELVGKKNEAGEPLIVKTNDSDLRIVRGLNQSEQADVIKITARDEVSGLGKA